MINIWCNTKQYRVWYYGSVANVWLQLISIRNNSITLKGFIDKLSLITTLKSIRCLYRCSLYSSNTSYTIHNIEFFYENSGRNIIFFLRLPYNSVEQTQPNKQSSYQCQACCNMLIRNVTSNDTFIVKLNRRTVSRPSADRQQTVSRPSTDRQQTVSRLVCVVIQISSDHLSIQ